jgi:small subunit ribosomal protein S20
MANHKSALKEHRQSLKKRDLNRGHRARMRTAIKKFRALIAGGDSATAQSSLNGMLSLVDHSSKLGAIHPNAAARTKSRLTRAVNKLSASA